MGDRGRTTRWSRRSLGVPLGLVVVVLALAGCGGGAGGEAAGNPWGTVADDSWGELPLDGGTLAPAPTLADGSPAPQVMAEVTVPGGAVPSVPQPAVPEALPPPVLRSPDPGAGRSPASTTTPPTTEAPPSAGQARALEALGNAAAAATAAQALGRIDYDWQVLLPGWQLRFLPGRSGYRGSTFPDSRVIEIYVRPGDTVDGLSHVIAHEIGHAVDVTHLDDGERAAWRSARGIGGQVPWFPGTSGAADYATGAGDFAESFARWQTGVDWYSQLGPPPDALQTALLARLVLP